MCHDLLWPPASRAMYNAQPQAAGRPAHSLWPRTSCSRAERYEHMRKLAKERQQQLQPASKRLAQMGLLLPECAVSGPA